MSCAAAADHALDPPLGVERGLGHPQHVLGKVTARKAAAGSASSPSPEPATHASRISFATALPDWRLTSAWPAR